MGKDVLSVWAVFVGSVIGAGFASGAETVTFFAVYGTSGLVGALVAGAVLALLGARLLLVARYEKGHEDVLRLLFGSVFPLMRALLGVFWLTMLSVMLSGAGALGASLGLGAGFCTDELACFEVVCKSMSLDLSEAVCSGMFAMILFVLSLGGMRMLPLANMVVTPLVILVVAVMTVASLVYHQDRLLPMMTVSSVPLSALTDPIYYASYNLAMCLPALASLSVRDKSAIRSGAMLAGATLAVLLVLLLLVVMLHYEEALAEPIPMLMVAEMQDASCYCGYALILTLSMVTSALGALLGISRLCAPYVRSERLCSALLLAVCFAISQAGFTTLVQTVLPMLAGASLVFTLRLCFPVRGGTLRH